MFLCVVIYYYYVFPDLYNNALCTENCQLLDTSQNSSKLVSDGTERISLVIKDLCIKLVLNKKVI